MIHNHLI